jgi:hypothetical protein
MKQQRHIKTTRGFGFLFFCLLTMGVLSSLVVITSTWSNEDIGFNSTPTSLTVLSDDYHSNHNFVVPVLGQQYVSWSLYQSNGIYGSFQVTSPASGADQIIDFFICDQDNYNLWDSGKSASVYQLQENIGSYSFHFKIPHDDTWYFVFKNHAVLTSKTINLDLYRDLTPPAIDMNLDAGATYSGIKEITATITEAQFSIGTVQLYIDGYLVHSETDSSFSYSWSTAAYTNGAHTIKISASDNVGNSGYEQISVLVSNIIPGTIAPTTTGSGGGNTGAGLEVASPIMLMSLLGIVGLIVVLGVVAKARGGSTRAPPNSGVLGTAQSVQGTTSHVREKETVSERFLVICPFCGSKNEQGTINCHSCGAKL